MSTPVIVYCFLFLFRRSKLGFDVASVGNWRESLATESTLAATVDRESTIWPSQLWIVRCVDYKTFSFCGVVGDNVGRWCATVQTTKLSDFRQIFTTNFQQLFLLYFSCSLSQGCLISSCLLTFLQISPPRFSAPTRNNQHSFIHPIFTVTIFSRACKIARRTPFVTVSLQFSLWLRLQFCHFYAVWLGSAWTTSKVFPISSFRFETEQHLTPAKNTSSRIFKKILVPLW